MLVRGAKFETKASSDYYATTWRRRVAVVCRKKGQRAFLNFYTINGKQKTKQKKMVNVAELLTNDTLHADLPNNRLVHRRVSRIYRLQRNRSALP